MTKARWMGAVLVLSVCPLTACGDDDDTTDVRDPGQDDAGRDAAVPDAGVDAGGGGGGGSDTAEPDAGPEPDAGVDAGDGTQSESFSAIYEEIFVVHGCPGCHTADNQHSFLNLSTRDAAFEGLVDTDSQGTDCGRLDVLRVAPFDAENSLLVWKLEGVDANGDLVCGSRMPFGGAPLEADEIARIRAWIDEGARDN